MVSPQAARSGQVPAAYQVVRDAALPANEYYRADFHFMCGWIALALSQRCRDRAGTFRAYRRWLGQSDRDRESELLARPRRRSIGDNDAMREAMRPPRAIPPPITDSWRAPSSASRVRITSAGARARADAALPTNACAPPTCSTRSASVTSSGVLSPISPKRAPTPPCWPRSANLTGRKTMPCHAGDRQDGARPRPGA